MTGSNLGWKFPPEMHREEHVDDRKDWILLHGGDLQVKRLLEVRGGEVSRDVWRVPVWYQNKVWGPVRHFLVSIFEFSSDFGRVQLPFDSTSVLPF